MLHRSVESRGPRLVLVHGFTQTLRSWDEIASLMANRFEVVRMDLPGHGGSGRARMSFSDTVEAIGEAGGQGVYVGYSMGGRLSLQLALEHPNLVEALVLIGASPGIPDHGERAARRRADERLAAELERMGTRAFVERWMSQKMFATLRPTEADLQARLANTPTGLANALRYLGTGVQEPLWERLVDLKMPVLMMIGDHDSKFSLVADRMAGSIGDRATVAHVADAGHAAHLEQPKPACRELWKFLARHGLAPTA